MKSQVTLHQNFSDVNFIDAEFNSEKQERFKVSDLYLKHDDEPDFDCEFLQGITYEYSDNQIDIESEEEQIDHYNDDQWDADIYDPYLESTYF